MARTVGFSFPVAVVVVAIGYIYFSTVFVFVDRWFGLWSSPGLMNAAIFTAVAAMCIYNYTVSVFRDPGRVPSTYMPDVEDSENPIHEIKRKGGDLRYCQKCSQYKPARAHHCRVCKRCVLRMDHHCIWINNCVGHANYKVFFVFVVYAVMACLYSLVLLLGSLGNDFEKDEEQSTDSYTTVYITSGLLLFPLSAALSVLLGWHIYLILQNKTTIEYHEGVRAMWLAEKGGQIYSHPYDLGAYQNLSTVYPLLFFFCKSKYLCAVIKWVKGLLLLISIYSKYARAHRCKLAVHLKCSKAPGNVIAFLKELVHSILFCIYIFLVALEGNVISFGSIIYLLC